MKMNAIKEEPGVNKGHRIHQDNLSQIFNHWRETEGKISLYGPDKSLKNTEYFNHYVTLNDFFISVE